ncbi:MAG: hypothetical protein SRB2_01683 [Desulfobacteraceae bacterium Eth-SRB2]|nr:MAG: hypothetical protein SRB2_01683 [Desulfobacteraceae bacterium Eth-SRB2]
MTSDYPKLIIALTEAAGTDQLRHFDLSSFMTGPPLKEVYEKIDRSMMFFSVYVAMEHMKDDLWEDSRYVDKEKVHLCSLVEEEVRRYWWGRNREHLKLIDERIESLKNDPEFKNKKEGDLRNKAIKELDQKMFPLAIERVKEEYQEIYEDEWEKYWKKEDPFKPRIEYEYHRRYDMPKPFNHWDSRNPWQQYYFSKDKDNVFYYAKGGSGSSGQRYDHGFYGHLFALLNSEHPVPTYFFTYDSHNNFVFIREETSLWLNFFDLVGNFKIDGKESERILRGVVNIRDRL